MENQSRSKFRAGTPQLMEMQVLAFSDGLIDSSSPRKTDCAERDDGR